MSYTSLRKASSSTAATGEETLHHQYGSLNDHFSKQQHAEEERDHSHSDISHNFTRSESHHEINLFNQTIVLPSIRKIALTLSLYLNVLITVAKLIAYLRTLSLSVLAALVDSVLDVVSQVVLNYTEAHSSMQRSSAHYPAGASRLEPIGVLTCAALMGMASFEVIKESITALADHNARMTTKNNSLASVYNMIAIVLIKLMLLYLCNLGAYKKHVPAADTNTNTTTINRSITVDDVVAKHVVQWADPTLEALAQDHWNDMLSNGVAAIALLLAVQQPSLWFLDPLGAILISMYIIFSWYNTGKEQIEHLTGKSAPEDFIDGLVQLAQNFDDRLTVDTVRAYHFGPKFLVEIEVVMKATTLLFESHDLGMDLQYEIEAKPEVERCFVHIDYQARPYDEHVVSKEPELLEKIIQRRTTWRSTQSV